MSCCDDPTEAPKVDPRDLLREQEHYGNLLRDLFTDNPETVMLRQLREASTYLRELAALRAHYNSVRFQAIDLLQSSSIAVLERIIEQDKNTKISAAAQQRLLQLNND
jgi:oligoribonuclease NrnB/cAMP/cGMP phosphodiesterase (DHH superfamily)